MAGRLGGFLSSLALAVESLAGRYEAGLTARAASIEDELTGVGSAGDRTAHRRLESVIERMSEIIYIKDADGRYELINSAGEALFDRPREEIVGERDPDLFGPAVAREIRTIDERVMAEREPTSYESTRTIDGEERVLRNDKFPYAPEGEVVGVIGVSRDVTEERARQHALERLHEATRELMAARSVQEVADVASVSTTHILDLPYNGVHVYEADRNALVPIAWSEATESILDAPPPEIDVDDSLAGQVFRSGEPRTYADVREDEGVLNDETVVRSELFLPLGEHGILLIGSPAVDDFDETDEALSRVLAANVETALDRIERERELERQNERLADFAGIVSHDLRNPLAIAEGRLDLAREECESEHLDAVESAHRRMSALVEDVLTWTREGREIEETVAVDVADLARRCWGSVADDDATLDVEDVVVEADRDRLRRVLENLFRNAVEHGGPGVSVRVGPLPAGGGFYVEDDGPGIPPDERGAIFEAGETTSDDGTGFGLAIVREIVEGHGWSIRATEGEAGGARFEIRGVKRPRT